jgi:hypothetical protein
MVFSHPKLAVLGGKGKKKDQRKQTKGKGRGKGFAMSKRILHKNQMSMILSTTTCDNIFLSSFANDVIVRIKFLSSYHGMR